MIKKKLILSGISLLFYSFFIILGLSTVNFLFKNEILSDRADFYKALWIVLTTTAFSSSIIFILRLKDGKSKGLKEDVKEEIKRLYSERDFIWNRKITMAYGITFLFLFFGIITSELLSFFFDEGLLSPVQLAFHTTAFVGYLATFRYVLKNQDYIEYKNRQMVKGHIKQEELKDDYQ